MTFTSYGGDDTEDCFSLGKHRCYKRVRGVAVNFISMLPDGSGVFIELIFLLSSRQAEVLVGHEDETEMGSRARKAGRQGDEYK
jgi:hypothetical protein